MMHLSDTSRRRDHILHRLLSSSFPGHEFLDWVIALSEELSNSGGDNSRSAILGLFRLLMSFQKRRKLPRCQLPKLLLI